MKHFRLAILLLLSTLVPIGVAASGAKEAVETTAERACNSGYRLFEYQPSAITPVCIPENPQRIIVMDQGTMADVIALGTTPIGVMDWGVRDYAGYLRIEDTMIGSVGTPNGPNYEAMISLQPDLIIVRSDNLEWFEEDALEIFREIGPTVVSPYDALNWLDHFLFIGNVLGEQGQAHAVATAFEARIREFRDTRSAQHEDVTISIIRSRAESFNIYAAETFIGELMMDAGLSMPAAYDSLPPYAAISVEQIDILTGDYLFVMARNEDEAEAFINASNGPLWQFLPAVENDQAYQVDWSVWVAGWNIVGANLVIDDLFHYLTEAAATTPNPVRHVVQPDFRMDMVTQGVDDGIAEP